MRRVQKGIANHLVTRLLERELTAREQAPGRLEMRIGSGSQGLARLGNRVVERARFPAGEIFLSPCRNLETSDSNIELRKPDLPLILQV
jgi:hypothetical protein